MQTLKDKTFHAHIEEAVERIKEKRNIREDKWISAGDAGALLNLKSQSALQELSDSTAIKSVNTPKGISLYDRASVMEYRSKN